MSPAVDAAATPRRHAGTVALYHVLVMHPTLKRALQAFSAATIRGLISPDSRGRTSRQVWSVRARAPSSRNFASNPSRSSSARSKQGPGVGVGMGRVDGADENPWGFRDAPHTG